jgi:hypothetical protein
MRSFGRRSLFLVCIGAVSVPLVAVALAYGCTAVATLSPSQTSAKAGTTISVTGRFFGTHDASTDATNSTAKIRLGSLTGPVLAEGSPAGQDRSFTVNVTIPAGTPAGETFLAATQTTATGTPVFGTPARQAITILPTTPAGGGGAGGGGTTNNRVDTTVIPQVVDTLTLSEARSMARMRVKRSHRGAKGIKASCSRRSRTSASCKVKWTSKGKKHSKKVLVKSQTSSAAW